jgi:hypothetical protein
MARRRSDPVALRLSLDTFRTWLLVLALFGLCYMCIIGLHPFTLKEKSARFTGDGDALRQLLYLGAFLITIATSIHKPMRLFALPTSLVVALGWCWLSTTWSLAPDIAVRRVALTTIIIMTVFRCVDELGIARTLALLRIVVVLTMVLCFIAVAFSAVVIHRG